MTSIAPKEIVLPCSPLLLCQDRLSLTESDDYEVPFWLVLQAVLAEEIHTVHNLTQLLETIDVTLRGSSSSPADYTFLRNFLNENAILRDKFLNILWPKVVKLALELPVLFADNTVPVLSVDRHTLTLSRRQAACLVVHQFLCTLPRPPWMESDGSPDFHIWYSSDQPHPKAAHAYLSALVAYFERIFCDESSPLELSGPQWPITATLRTGAPIHGSSTAVAFTSLRIAPVPEPSTRTELLGLPHGACVISANKHIGFGRTGTQEEVQVGSTPECCPMVLIVPPLQDGQVFVVEGVESMVCINGYGREARLESVLDADCDVRTYEESQWRHRTMLFMDALELDSFDSKELVPDLLPGHLDRELLKAFTAFSSSSSASRDRGPYTEVVTGLWGCGVFGGDEQIKTIIQWCAALIAQVPLTFVCVDAKAAFIEELSAFVAHVYERKWTVEDVLRALRQLEATNVEARNSFAYVSRSLAD